MKIQPNSKPCSLILLNEHAPANQTESLLVQRMAQSWWLTQRAIRLQNQVFTDTDLDTRKLALFLRYQTTHKRAFYKALNTLTKLSRACQQAAIVLRNIASDENLAGLDYPHSQVRARMRSTPLWSSRVRQQA